MKTENKDLEKILNRLRKLKTFYEGAKKINSEGEAAAAAAKIQRLLTQYNLSMEEITPEERNDEVMHEVASGYTFKSIGGIWEFKLVHVLAKWNFCQAYIYGNSYKTILLVGKPENVETVKWLRSLLSEKFVSFSKDRYKEYKETIEYHLKPIGLDTYQRSYLIGATEGLDAKLKVESDADKAKDADYGAKVTALVVRNSQAVQEYIDLKFKKGGTRKSSMKTRSGAHAAGFKDGKNVELYKPINGNVKVQASKVKLIS